MLDKNLILYFDGGLGNQLFQYSLLLHLKENGIYPVISKSAFRVRGKNRQFVLDRLINNDFADGAIDNLYDGIVQQVSKKFFKNRRSSIISDRNFDIRYISQEMRKKRKLKIHGNFQHTDYVQDRKSIRNDIILKDLDPQFNGKSVNVCVHFRKGDYLSAKNNKIFASLNDNYFINSMLDVQNRFQDKVTFNIYSDDFSLLPPSLNNYGFDFKLIDIFDSVQCFQHMVQNDHFIIANSTYSWWAAYLSGSQSIVWAPPHWYEEKDYPNFVKLLNLA